MTEPAYGTPGYVFKLYAPTLEDASVGGIMEAARKLKKAGSTVEDVYGEASEAWGDMGRYYESPDTEMVTHAFPTNMKVYSDAAKQSSHEVAGAALDFSATLVDLKSRYNALNNDIHRHNLHPLEEVTAHQERAWDLEDRKSPIMSDLEDAETTARDRINAVNLTTMVAKETTGGTVHSVAQRGVKFLKAWTEIGGNFDLTSADKVFAGKHVDPEQIVLMFRSMDVTKFPASMGERMQGILTPTMWKKVKDLFPNSPSTPKTAGVTAVNLKVNIDVKPGSWAEKLGKLPDSTGFKTFASGLDKVGKVAAVADTAVTYYDTYSGNYNESVLENPAWSAEQHRNEALTSAAIEGTAETAGKAAGAAAGQTVGRVAGAAVGQALIPIPGVGAAVGGLVGGFVGSWAGEKVGGAIGESVGDEFNEWRKNGDLGSVGDALGAAGEGVVEGGKSIWKGVRGLVGLG